MEPCSQLVVPCPNPWPQPLISTCTWPSSHQLPLIGSVDSIVLPMQAASLSPSDTLDRAPVIGCTNPVNVSAAGSLDALSSSPSLLQADLSCSNVVDQHNLNGETNAGCSLFPYCTTPPPNSLFCMDPPATQFKADSAARHTWWPIYHSKEKDDGVPELNNSSNINEHDEKKLTSAHVTLCSSSQLMANGPASATRVRARRGEATDLHSISERKRRIKITERMRALHKLVPDGSKTNKAAMLDEVIQYVRDLQARLKGKWLGGADSGGTPISSRAIKRARYNVIERVLDPLEDTLVEAERQVSRLLERSDLRAALHFLGARGLSLLPISTSLSKFVSTPLPPSENLNASSGCLSTSNVSN